jgi:hypothetical protein
MLKPSLLRQRVTSLKRIAILHRFGHQLDEEAQACLMALERAGIPAQLGGVQHGHNIISLEIKEDVGDVTSLLRTYGFAVMAVP